MHLVQYKEVQIQISARKKIRRQRLFLIRSILCAATAIIVLIHSSFLVFGDTPEGQNGTSEVQETSATDSSPGAQPDVFSPTILLDNTPANAPSINGTAYVLYDAQSDTFLFGENVDVPLHPASTTKILTILLAIENLNPEDTITVTKEMFDYIPEGYVRLPLAEDELITVNDAMYASLLLSANDACSALAFKMAGSKEAFSEMMNEKARELGCLSSNFSNPFGLPEDNHKTTVHDMAILLEAAMEYDVFNEISTASSYTIKETNKFNEKRVINNQNRFISTTTYAYEYYVGGKTGFANASGHTIAAAAVKDGRLLIGVIFGADSSEIRYSNLIEMFNYGFSQYTTSAIDQNELGSLQIDTARQIETAIADYGLYISDRQIDTISHITTSAAQASGGYTTSIDLSSAVIAPNVKSQTHSFPIYRLYSNGAKNNIGTLSVTIKNRDIIDESEGNKLTFKSVLQTIIKVVVVLILIAFICIAGWIYYHVQKRRKTIKNRRKPKVL